MVKNMCINYLKNKINKSKLNERDKKHLLGLLRVVSFELSEV